MRRYGQFCPVAKTAEVFCQRWTALVLRDLSCGSTRFSELQRGVPLMSPTLLSQRLKMLEGEGIIERRVDGHRTTYHLTAAGRELTPIIEAMGVWGQRWTRRDLAPEEIDMDLLLWGIESHARADAFAHMPSLVAVTLTDQPAHKRNWWFLNADGRCQLCIDDPGHETDLYLSGTVANFIRVYRGDIRLARALDDGRIEAAGTASAVAALGTWLNLSPLTRVPSLRQEAAISAP